MRSLLRNFPAISILVLQLITFDTPTAHTEPHYEINQELCTAIAALTPSIPDQELVRLTDTIDVLSKKYSIDWKIPVAIFKQESNFNYKAVNYKSRDFGIGQMHFKTIESRNLDLGELLTNPTYAVDQSLQLLKELQQKYAKIDAKSGRKWYTRYHSFTPSFRDTYRELLSNHLKVIEETLHVKKAGSKRGNQERDQRPVCIRW